MATADTDPSAELKPDPCDWDPAACYSASPYDLDPVLSDDLFLVINDLQKRS